jgi:hypothetical protein
MKSDFYFENVSGDWRENVMKITNVDWKFFRKNIAAEIGSHTTTLHFRIYDRWGRMVFESKDTLADSTISGIPDFVFLFQNANQLSVSIGNFNVIHIFRLEDDYFRVWMEFRKRTESNLISKNKPRKNKIKNYWFEDGYPLKLIVPGWYDCRKDLICDNREGVLKSMEDFGLFKNLT